MPAIRLVLLLAVGLVATSGQGAELQPIAAWRFDRQSLHESRFAATAGKLAVRAGGPVKFASDPPGALLLQPGGPALVVADKLSAADLPRRALSVEAWVRPAATPDWAGIASAIQDNGDYEQGWLLGTQGEQFMFALSTQGANDGDGRLTYLNAGVRFEPENWYHVVATYDGKTQRIFVDGRLKNESTQQSGDVLYPPRGVFVLGAYRDDDENHPLTGALAEIKLYDAALSPEQVAARFDARQNDFPGSVPAPPQNIGWPTYLRDEERTGITPEALELPLALKWVYTARHPPAPAWPEPAVHDFWNKKQHSPRVTYDRAYHVVSVDGQVVFGSSASDQVVSLDAATGEEQWSFFAEGPVRLAPTLHQGRVYFGSDDGCVYCLNARDGRLHWKYNAAPTSRRIPGNGRIISVWPVRSGVLVKDGVARFAAGLFPLQGTYQYAVDAESGREVARGPLPISPQGYLERRGSQLIVSAGRAPKQFFAQLRRHGKGSDVVLGTLPREYPFALIGAGDLRFAGGDGRVAAFSADDGELVWRGEVAGRADSLAVADGRLLVSTDQGKIYCFTADQTGKPLATGPVDDLAGDKARKDQHDFHGAISTFLKEYRLQHGYCLVLGSQRGELAAQYARQSNLTVVAIDDDAERVRVSRRVLDAEGLYGRVSLFEAPLDALPLGDSLFNLVVMEREMDDKALFRTLEEVKRVLVPGGIALIGRTDNEWSQYERPALPDAGEWTHLYANPANTVCSDDAHVAGPLALQWFGRPGPRLMVDRHHRTTSPLYAGGRLFVPGNDHVFAVDAYNGSPLWDHPVKEFRRIGIMRDCGSMAATDDVLYVAAGGECLRFEAASGTPLPAFAVPKSAGDATWEWGYVAIVGDRLFGTAVRHGASRRGHSRAAIEEGAYFDNRPIVVSDRLFCMDRNTGEMLWTYDQNQGALLNPTITIGGRRVFFVESDNVKTRSEPTGRAMLAQLIGDGATLVALDAATGKTVWKTTPDVSAIEQHLYLAYAESVDRVVAVGSRNQESGQVDDRGRPIHHVWYDTHAIDAKSGKPVWFKTQNNLSRAGGDHGEQDHHPVIVGDRIYVEPFAYDLKTGDPLPGWKLNRGGHGCGAMSASLAAGFFRADNPTMCDLATGQLAKVNRVTRPGCWISVLPAGGLVLMPEASSGCSCDFPLQTSMAFIPQRLLQQPTSAGLTGGSPKNGAAKPVGGR